MFIRIVDDSLERMLRGVLPLPEELGDVSFDIPSGNWSAQLSRITVNLYLYQAGRSTQPGRSLNQRTGANGNLQRRQAQPMIELRYLISAWAGSPRDEHQLLGDLISRLMAVNSIPEQYLTGELSSAVSLSADADDDNKLREIWGGAHAPLKAAFTLQATVAADSFDWTEAPPSVERIQALVRTMANSAPPPPVGR
jgi:hypothetical protein